MKRSFPVIRQHDSMQCGLACLSTICQFYGKHLSIKELSDLCFATTEGVSLLAISDAANHLGLHTIAGHLTLEQLHTATLPCILHWNQNHFVVLYKVKKKYYYVADPAKGRIKYLEKDFVKCWVSSKYLGEENGIAMLLKPTPIFYSTNNTTSKENSSFKFLYNYTKLYHRYFFQIILGLFVGCLLQLVLPFLTQSIVDVGIKNQDIAFVWLILLGQLMLTTSRTVIDFIRRWLLLHISMRINISLLSDFLMKLMKLPMSFFDTKLMGDLIQRMNDHGRVEKFLTAETLTIMFSGLSVIVFGIVLWAYHSLIFIVFLMGSVLYGGWLALFLHRRKLLDYELFERQAENNNKTYQLITFMQEIKLQGCEQHRRWEWEDVQADLFQVQMKSMKLNQTQEAGCIFINEVKNVVITVLSASAVIHGDITLGMMLAIQYIIGQLNSPIEQLMKFFYAFQDVNISLKRINEIHQIENEDDGNRLIMTNKDETQGIVLNNVCFKYNPHCRENIVEDINIIIPKGKVTAIVGVSGSGKSTLIKLMLGYYPVLSGCLSVGGNNIKSINLKWWRKQCGVVMQDGVLFSESIARNIAVDDERIDVVKLEKAAEIACIKDFVMKLPLKFNTKIGQDGIGISQGQRQRLLIARAIYKNPDFLFLDEATNSLDAKNEAAIVENLAHFFEGRTVIVVAHRLSTVRNADQIVVIDKGKIAETGNHSSLVKKRGTYYHLVKNQLELGL